MFVIVFEIFEKFNLFQFWKEGKRHLLETVKKSPISYVI